MPCDHFFHKECLMPWLQEHNTCPTCRASVDEEGAPEPPPVAESQPPQRTPATHPPIAEAAGQAVSNNTEPTGAAAAPHASLGEFLSSLRVRQLKALLLSLGVDYSGCVERGELMQLAQGVLERRRHRAAADPREAAQAPPPSPGIRQQQAVESTPGYMMHPGHRVGDEVMYRAADGVFSPVTIAGYSTNVPEGEEAMIAVLLPDGSVRDTVPDRICTGAAGRGDAMDE